MILKKLRNIIVGWFNKIFNRENKLAEKRLAICNNCPKKVKFLGEDVCDICLCVIDAKVRVKEEQCHDGKW